MKKVIFSLAILLSVSLSSCNVSKNFSNFLTSHNYKESHVLDPMTGKAKYHGSIEGLYDYSKVEALCDTADVTFHISRGSIVIEADCSGAGESLVPIIKNLFAKIQFKK